MNTNILVVDDSEGIVDILSGYLEEAGFIPIPAFDGEEAIAKYRQYNPALILLDIMMPKKNGLEVMKEVRKNSITPIIMITAKGEDTDIVTALEMGADDYVVKPFSPKAVIARVKAVLRRMDISVEDEKQIIRLPDLEINLADYEVKILSKLVNLTKKEIEILWLLASNPSRVYSRDNLLNIIWGYEYYGDSRCVDTHIKRIRAKLDLHEQYAWDIKTIWGVGYKFEVKDAKE